MTFINPTMSKTKRLVAVRSTRWLETSPHPGLRKTTCRSIPDAIFAQRFDTMPTERPDRTRRQPWHVYPARSFRTFHLKTLRIDGSAELRVSPRALAKPECFFTTAVSIINGLRRFNGVMRLSLTTKLTHSRDRAAKKRKELNGTKTQEIGAAHGCWVERFVMRFLPWAKQAYERSFEKPTDQSASPTTDAELGPAR